MMNFKKEYAAMRIGVVAVALIFFSALTFSTVTWADAGSSSAALATVAPGATGSSAAASNAQEQQGYQAAIAQCDATYAAAAGQAAIPGCDPVVQRDLCHQAAQSVLQQTHIADGVTNAEEGALKQLEGCLANMFPGWNFNFSTPSLNQILGGMSAFACNAAMTQENKSIQGFSQAVSYDPGQAVGIPGVVPLSAGTQGGAGVSTGYNGTLNGSTVGTPTAPADTFSNLKSFLSK